MSGLVAVAVRLADGCVTAVRRLVCLSMRLPGWSRWLPKWPRWPVPGEVVDVPLHAALRVGDRGCCLLRSAPPKKYWSACACPHALSACTTPYIAALDFCWRCRSLVLMRLERMYNTVGGNAPPGRCPPCSLGESRATWCARCCVPLGVCLLASGVLGFLLPHAALCPPGVRSSVRCSSGRVVSAS